VNVVQLVLWIIEAIEYSADSIEFEGIAIATDVADSFEVDMRVKILLGGFEGDDLTRSHCFLASDRTSRRHCGPIFPRRVQRIRGQDTREWAWLQ